MVYQTAIFMSKKSSAAFFLPFTFYIKHMISDAMLKDEIQLVIIILRTALNYTSPLLKFSPGQLPIKWLCFDFRTLILNSLT